MKNNDELIGKKMEGFKFSNSPFHDYSEEMDEVIGETGVITKFVEETGYYKVEFEKDYWYYPAEFVEDHLLP